MISGVSQVTITTAAASIVLTKIDAGGCEYLRETIKAKDVSSKALRLGDRAHLVITAYDIERYPGLRDIMIAKTNVTNIEVRGIAEHIYWKSATTLIVRKNIKLKTGGRDSLTFWVKQIGNDLSPTIYTTTALE